MIDAWTAVGIGVASFLAGGTIGVLAVSITAISKNDFGRDDGAMIPESQPEPEQLTMLAPIPKPARKSRLLTAQQAARRIGMSQRWIYDHKLDLPFTVRTGRRSYRFDPVLLAEWVAAKKAGRR